MEASISKKAEVLNIGLCHNYFYVHFESWFCIFNQWQAVGNYKDGANFYVLISLFNQACTNKFSEVQTRILHEFLTLFKLTEWKRI